MSQGTSEDLQVVPEGSKQSSWGLKILYKDITWFLAVSVELQGITKDLKGFNRSLAEV